MRRGNRGVTSIAGGLLALVTFAGGVMNWGSDRAVLKYYNSFFQAAYSEVVVEGWNKLVERSHEENVSDDELLKTVKANFLPAAEKWAKLAGIAEVPEGVEAFHTQFVSTLKFFEKSSKEIAAAIESQDQEALGISIVAVNERVQGLNEETTRFQALLQKEHGITFEQNN